MKPHQIALSLVAIGLAVLAGCREETTRSEDYPHIATRYEDDSIEFNQDVDFDVPTTAAGGWFNVGQAPGIYLWAEADGTDFDFNNPYSFADHSANYYLDYFTSGNLVADGVVAGSSISWTAHDGIDEAEFTGTFTGGGLSGNVEYQWFGLPYSQQLNLVRVPSLFGSAAEQSLNTEATYTLDASKHYQVVKLTINEPTVGVRAETVGTGFDTWLWLFDSEGGYLKNNDVSYAGNGVDARIETFLNQNDYYFIITQFGSDTVDVKFRLLELQLNTNN